MLSNNGRRGIVKKDHRSNRTNMSKKVKMKI